MISVVIPPRVITTLIPAGMDKSGTQSHSVAGGYMQVTGWGARSGWTNGPSSNALVATAGGVAILSGSLNLDTGFVQKSVRIKQNSTVIFTYPVTTTSSPLVFTVHANVTAGDVFTMESYCSINTETIQTTNTYLTMKLQEFAFTPHFTDNFNRSNGNLSATSGWDDSASLAKPQISSNQIIGTGDVNARSLYATGPSGSRAGQYFKITVAGIGNNRVGLAFAGTNNAANSACLVFLTSTTSMSYGYNTSTSQSNGGTVDGTITVPAVTAPVEMLVMLTSDTTADFFLGRVYVGTYNTFSGYGQSGGLITANTTDIVDDYEQGTWV